MHAVKNESVSFGTISRGGPNFFFPTTEANWRGLTMWKSQDCPRSFPTAQWPGDRGALAGLEGDPSAAQLTTRRYQAE